MRVFTAVSVSRNVASSVFTPAILPVLILSYPWPSLLLLSNFIWRASFASIWGNPLVYSLWPAFIIHSLDMSIPSQFLHSMVSSTSVSIPHTPSNFTICNFV